MTNSCSNKKIWPKDKFGLPKEGFGPTSNYLDGPDRSPAPENLDGELQILT